MPENTTHESPAYEKRGYLNHEFRLFHLRGQMDTPVAYHYHDFHKVLILLNGEADYIVEGRSYHLRPLTSSSSARTACTSRSCHTKADMSASSSTCRRNVWMHSPVLTVRSTSVSSLPENSSPMFCASVPLPCAALRGAVKTGKCLSGRWYK